MNSQRLYNTFYRLYPLVDRFLLRQKKRLAALINRLPEGRLLEIGMGNGSLLRLIGRHTITGIDTSYNMLKMAAARDLQRVESLKVMNGEQLAFASESFDYVVINHVLAVTADPERMLKEAFRVLRKEGLLLIHNHFTPANSLGFLDRLFSCCSHWFGFRSWFPVEKLSSLDLFQPVLVVSGKPFGYYRLLILRK